MENVLLFPGSGATNTQAGLSDLNKALEEIEKAGKGQAPEYGKNSSEQLKGSAYKLIEALNSTSDPFLREELNKLHYMITMAVDVKSSGDGSWEDKLNQIKQYVNKPNPQEKQASFNLIKTAAPNSTKKAVENLKKEDDKQKRKSNPFKVLMGQVGKLLDHGIPKGQIRRYLTKNTQFEEETINNAIKIVMDYNKDKERKSSHMSRVASKDDIMDGIKSERHKPVWFLRSTGELTMRLSFLSSVLESLDSEDKKEAKKDMAEIKSILKSRGFNND
jgi:hypothetical protein